MCVCVRISDSQELTAFSAYFFSCPDRTSFFLENPSLFTQNYDSTFSGSMAEKWHWHTERDNHSDRHQWLTLRWSCGQAGHVRCWSSHIPLLVSWIQRTGEYELHMPRKAVKRDSHAKGSPGSLTFISNIHLQVLLI